MHCVISVVRSHVLVDVPQSETLLIQRCMIVGPHVHDTRAQQRCTIGVLKPVAVDRVRAGSRSKMGVRRKEGAAEGTGR
jgi:hypothetical protein